ncbi:serine hydrolase domain-containing protein [Streptomyces rapamycinicus]|uniref:Beta-lactamase n=2 Tax=Streptomyces rapamycinicus TaxID=1226757 RepID=A0A3L8RFY7_STRRN|nr:serine hydrolase domain-containing protein [Streptomyces rapamycinicus]MBB4786067.1 CubicO group peptidase (beta-lactamase class C family) [Streptomyces rapamycinicus]RLV78470.1 beta-lactamase [Streptomyces rapamycinicus NRRL 5491]UTO66189.1 beta-lactamase family protein [Streptomyces rapamycinicus]UTP34144.1 beta-lactamase family protein [Streptomyces rapamycinicus NRRL 5491]
MNVVRRRRVLSGGLTLAVAAGVAAATKGAVAAAPRGDGAPRRNTTADHTPRLRAILHRLTTADGVPGALVAVRNRRGSSVLTSGVANVKSHPPMRRDSRFRIGSMTKPFVATVVLQLVGERRIVLDAPVERYLPGVIRGHGNDGRIITVRQLLQHTSGIPDYLAHLTPQEVLRQQLETPRSRARAAA